MVSAKVISSFYSHAGTLCHTKRDPDEDHTRKGRIKMERFFKKDQKGFTLIEVMLVVIIIGIIAVIALPRLLVTRDQAADASCKSNLQALRTANEQYKWDTGAYGAGGGVPALITTLSAVHAGTGVSYLPANSTVSGDCPGAGSAHGTYAYAATTGTISCSIHSPAP